jgi:hypothetical protein
MDATGNGIRLVYTAGQFAYLKNAPKEGRQQQAWAKAKHKRKLVVNQKLFGCFNGEGQAMEQVYVYSHDNAPEDDTPVYCTLNDEGHDGKNITILFVRKNLTNKKVVEWILLNKVLPFIQKVRSKNGDDHVVFTFDGDPDQLDAIRTIIEIADKSLIRLCKFNPSQTHNEQDADVGTMHKDHKTRRDAGSGGVRQVQHPENFPYRRETALASQHTLPYDLRGRKNVCRGRCEV